MVAVHRHQVEGRQRRPADIEAGCGRVVHDGAVATVADPGDGLQPIAGVQRAGQVNNDLIALAPRHDIRFRHGLQSLIGGEGHMRTAQYDDRLGHCLAGDLYRTGDFRHKGGEHGHANHAWLGPSQRCLQVWPGDL